MYRELGGLLTWHSCIAGRCSWCFGDSSGSIRGQYTRMPVPLLRPLRPCETSQRRTRPEKAWVGCVSKPCDSNMDSTTKGRGADSVINSVSRARSLFLPEATSVIRFECFVPGQWHSYPLKATKDLTACKPALPNSPCNPTRARRRAPSQPIGRKIALEEIAQRRREEVLFSGCVLLYHMQFRRHQIAELARFSWLCLLSRLPSDCLLLLCLLVFYDLSAPAAKNHRLAIRS